MQKYGVKLSWAVVILAGSAWYGTVSQAQPAAAQTGRAAAEGAVERVPVSKGAIRILKEVPLSTEIPGHLVYVNPTEEGQLVAQGEVVLRLKDDVIRAQHELAQKKASSIVEISFAEVALEKANIDLQVQIEANQRSPGAYTDSEIRQSRLEVRKAEAQLEKSQEDQVILQLEAATKGVELKQYEVASPIDGVVTEVHRWPGEAVRQGDPVLTITDLRVVRAVLDVEYAYRDMVSVGDTVEIVATGNTTASTDAADEDVTPVRPSGRSILSDLDNRRPASESPAQSPTSPGTTPGSASNRTTGSAPANIRPSQIAGEKFLGTVSYISTKLTPGAKRELEVYVNVPNRQDSEGRYLLLEGVEVRASILHAK